MEEQKNTQESKGKTAAGTSAKTVIRYFFAVAVFVALILGGLGLMIYEADMTGTLGSVGCAVGYGVLALCVVIAAYIALVSHYTHNCHTTVRKVGMVAAVIFMAFVVRFSLQMYAGVLEAAANAENGGVFDAGAGFIEALYGTFGGLTFEGMDPLIEGGGVLVRGRLAASYAYSGVAVLAALFFYTAVSLSVDYPMNCAVAAKFKRIGGYLRRRKCRRDVYIFDSVTEDTVLLAEDIVRAYAVGGDEYDKYIGWLEDQSDERKKAKRAARERDDRHVRALLCATHAWKKRFCGKISDEDEKGKIILTDLRKDRIQRETDDSVAWRMSSKRRCLIVFTGRDMKPFERRDQLHRRLMANGFLYLRYDFGRDMREVKRKGESSACRGVLADFIKSARNIHFFAFSRNDDFKEQFGKKYKSEQVNFRTVSEEIAALEAYSHRRRISRIPPKFHTPARICFYILSEDDVDHPTYSVRFDDWGRKLGENNKFLAGVILDYKIINEAERATWKLAFSLDDHGDSDNNILTHKSGEKCKEEDVEAARKKQENLLDWIKEYVKVAHAAYGSTEEPDKKATGQLVGGKADIAIVTREQNGNGVKEGSALSGCKSYDDYSKKRDEEGAGSEIAAKRILSLGFGDTARKTIGGLYVNNDGNMIVDVMDRRASNIMGGYMRSHPSVLCRQATCGFDHDPGKDAARKDAGGAGVLRVVFDHDPGKDAAHNEPEKWWMYGYNNLLAVNYAELDGTGDTAAKYIDDSFGNRDPGQKENYDELDGTGDTAAECIDDSFGNRDPGQKENYDAFIIALGDDELNLDCFRNVMSDIRRELIDRAAGKTADAIDPKKNLTIKKLTIFVHLREKGNAERLYWAAKREIEAIKEHVDVKAYGAREDVYTYDEIVNDAKAIEMNYEYNLAAGWAGTKNRFELWNEQPEFGRWSSKAASAFFATLKRLEDAAKLVCEDGIEDEEARLICSRLSGVAEHRRWSRFHYVNGFIRYSPGNAFTLEPKQNQGRDLAKYNLVHRLLTSFSALGDAQANNDANGIVAKKCVEERDPKKTV